MVDEGSVVDIIYLDAYKRMGLGENALSPTTSLLYEFIRDHIVPKGMAKLAIIVGEHPRTSTIIAPSAINGIIRRLILKVLKAITSIYHLIIKFPIIEVIGEIRGCQYD